MYPAQLARSTTTYVQETHTSRRYCLRPRGLRLQAGCQGDRRAPSGRVSSSGCSGAGPDRRESWALQWAGRQAVPLMPAISPRRAGLSGQSQRKKPSWSRHQRMKRAGGHKKVCQEAQVMLGGPDRTADRRPDLEQRLCHRPPTHIVNCFMPMNRPQTKHKVSYRGE